jgi:hypothetical protein
MRCEVDIQEKGGLERLEGGETGCSFKSNFGCNRLEKLDLAGFLEMYGGS